LKELIEEAKEAKDIEELKEMKRRKCSLTNDKSPLHPFSTKI